MRTSRAVSVLLALSVPAGLVAQDTTASAASTPRSGCAVLNGIRMNARWGDSTGGAAAAAPARAPTNRTRAIADRRTTIDTTFAFNVAERRWTRPSLDAMVAAGASGQRSTTPWLACVGITLAMEQPTIVLRGVRGQLHLKVDLTPLARIPGSGLSDTSRRNQNRR